MKDSLLFLRFASKKKKKSYIPELLFVITTIISAVVWDRPLHNTGGLVLFSLWVLILFFLFSLALVNLQTMLLPNALIKPLAAVVIGFQVVNAIQQGSGSVLWAAILGGIILGGIPYILFQVSSGRWIGGGDTKLGFVAGLLLGWKLALLCVGIMLVLVALSFLAAYIAGKLQKNPTASRTETGILWTSAIILSMLVGVHFIK